MFAEPALRTLAVAEACLVPGAEVKNSILTSQITVNLKHFIFIAITVNGITPKKSNPFQIP